MKKKVVLAFSGGLDTSYCVKYLTSEKNLDVYSVVVDTGGFSNKELKRIEQTAEILGVKKHITINKTEVFYQECLRYLVFGNVLKNASYPLSVSAERIFQAIAIAKYAKQIKADFIAHGSTGAGNDQVRFDMIFSIITPEIEILTPIRDQKLSREEEIKYLVDLGIEMDWKKMRYSINQGLWGTTIGGIETLTSDQALPDEAYPGEATEKDAKIIKLDFNKGEIIAVDDNSFSSPVEAIRYLNKLGEKYGIGRDIHVGDTIIGIKGRVAFEAPAPLLLINAHRALEKHVLTKWQIHWKDQMAGWYGMMLHEGHFLDPVMRDIEMFIENTQQFASGSVYIKLLPYTYIIQGVKSDHDLMNAEFGKYGEENLAWDGNDVRGFAKIAANQTKIFHNVNNTEF